MPDINGNYLDTSRSKVKASYTDKDVKKPSASLAGLYNAADQAKSEAANYKTLNNPMTDPNGVDTGDSILRDAKQFLQASQPFSALLAHDEADRAAADEQARTQSRASLVAPVADAVQDVTGFTSMIPGPIGVGSRGAFALAGLGKAADPTSTAGVGERLMDAGTGVIPEVLPYAWRGAKALGNAARIERATTQAVDRGFPAMVRGGESGSKQVGQTMWTGRTSVPDVERYWDGATRGEPLAQARSSAASSPESLKALESLRDAGSQSREQIANRARTVPTPETPARSMPTDPRADFGSAHSTPGVDANTVMDDSGRVLGSNPFYSADALSHPGSLKYQTEQYAQNHPLAVSLLGDRVRTPEEIAQRLSSENPLAWKPDMVDMPNGSTVPGGNGGTPHPGAGMDNQSLRALRDAAQARYTKQVEGVIPSNLTKDPAQEAILYGGETGSPLFGGASAREAGNGPKAGKFVRPSKRTPIGKGKK